MGPILELIDFLFEFVSFKRIRENGNRTSDFYDLLTAKSDPPVTTALKKTSVPKPSILNRTNLRPR